MRISTRRPLRIVAAGLALVAAGTVSCNDLPTAPQSAPPVLAAPGAPAFDVVSTLPAVRFSEIHYDNVGGDVGEAIEISAPGGTDLTGWKIYLYNGNGGAVYTPTATLSGTVTASCDGRGVVVQTYSANGIQNGDPDGIALVDPAGKVVEFLSYGGVMTAVGGPANGLVSQPMDAKEPSNSPVDFSLQRNSDGTWNDADTNTFGTCNDNGPIEPAAVVDHVTLAPLTQSVVVGVTKTFVATAYDASNEAIPRVHFTWSSSKEAIATVGGGIVTGVAAGEAQISATASNGVAASATITVVDPIPPAVVTVSPADARIYTVGQSKQFAASAKDAAGSSTSATYVWTSSDPAVATVSTAGLARAVKIGTTTITATAQGTTVAGQATLVVSGSYVLPSIRFSELHYDNGGTDVGERLEIEGPAGTVLSGWSIVLYDGGTNSAGVTGGAYTSTPLNGTLKAGQGACSSRGVLSVDFAQIQNGSPDGFALVDASGTVVEFLSYEGEFKATGGPANGMLSWDIGVLETGSGPNLGSMQRSATNVWTVVPANNFGSVNACGGTPLAPPPTIAFSGRASTDPALPVGFQAQIFATYSVNGVVTPTTITWTSETPSIATIDGNGLITSVAPGEAIFRATAQDGTTRTYALSMTSGVRSSMVYVGNGEFGEPTDADGSDDYLVRRPEYTTSYNANRGTPNWVSYRVDPTYRGAEDRCNCFTFDPLLPASFQRYTTADYTGAGAIAGFGIDRGHLARSSDRTLASLDNAATFYFSNIIPQASDNNQGPWAVLETALGDSAAAGREVFVIAGAYGNKGTVRNEGKIVIPTKVWKVAVLLPTDKSLADVRSMQDLNVIAVIMPNAGGIRNVDWKTYKTTVEQIQQESGYDILAALPDNIERAVETGDKPPVASFTSSATKVNEGGSIAFDGSASTDADDAIASYVWTFGDGTTATGAIASHTFADNGEFTVTLTVTDARGVYGVSTLPVTITNVAPTAQLVVSGPVVEGSPIEFTLANATDAPGDQATLTFAYACSATESWRTSTTSSFSCPTTDDGTFTVRAKVTDKDDGSTEYSREVSVANAAPVIAAFTTPTAPASVGAPVSATLTYTDLGSSDTHSATLAWGDGTTSTVTASAGQVAGTHTYAAAGFYTISVTLRDDDGGTAVASSSSAASVYDAAAGDVQAQGWLPAAGVTTANRRDDDERDGARNRKQFSLDAEYGRGATPRGDFTFVSLADRIALRGRVFEYLVVKEQTATVRGTGLLADGTAAGFLVYAVDGKLARDRGDRVRIRIWNQATGAVLFDTEPGVGELASQGTPLGGGNVKLSRSRNGDDGQRGNDDDKRGEH